MRKILDGQGEGDIKLRKSILGLPRRDLKAVIPVHPSGLRGYTGRGLLPPHFKGIGGGATVGDENSRAAPLPGILLKGVLSGVPGGFPLAGLDSITRSFSLKKNDLE